MPEVFTKNYAPPDRTWTRATLPRPFLDSPWRDDKAEAAAAFWDWHAGLSLRATNRDSLRTHALEHASRYAIDEAEVLMQASAADRMAEGLRLQDADDFNAFVRQWTGAHTRLLAALAGVGGYSWQQPMLDALSRAYFLTGALMALPDDLERDIVAFPLTELEKAGVTVAGLKTGDVTPAVKRLLWRMTVWARDNFANSVRLVDEGSRREAAAFRNWWFAGAEMLNVIERNDFDVGRTPPELSMYRRLLVRFQARFGNFTFK